MQVNNFNGRTNLKTTTTKNTGIYLGMVKPTQKIRVFLKILSKVLLLPETKTKIK